MSEYQEIKPSSSLSAYLECIWYFDSFNTQAKPPRVILPDNCIDILFDFSDGPPSYKAYVVGMMTKPIESTRSKLLALRFKPGQAYPFFKMPMSDITDRAIDLKDLIPKEEYLKFARIFDFEYSVSNLPMIESTLNSMLGNISESDQRVLHAINSIEMTSVEGLSKKLNISRQHLKRIFSQYVGISPKKFNRIQRLNVAIDHVRSLKRDKIDWASVAHRFDYVDQSHFIKDFKAISGTTPTQYFFVN